MFTKSVPVATFHNGKAIWLTVCTEMVAGRAESFVSIKPRKESK